MRFQEADSKSCQSIIEMVEAYEEHRLPSFECRRNGTEMKIAFALNKEPDEVILRQLISEIKYVDGVRSIEVTGEG